LAFIMSIYLYTVCRNDSILHPRVAGFGSVVDVDAPCIQTDLSTQATIVGWWQLPVGDI